MNTRQFGMLMELEFLLEPHSSMSADQLARIAQHVAFKESCKCLGFDVAIAYDEPSRGMAYTLVCGMRRRIFIVDIHHMMYDERGLHIQATDLAYKTKQEITAQTHDRGTRCPKCGEPVHASGTSFICGSHVDNRNEFCQSDVCLTIQARADARAGRRNTGASIRDFMKSLKKAMR